MDSPPERRPCLPSQLREAVMLNNTRNLEKMVGQAAEELRLARQELETRERNVAYGVLTPSAIHALEAAKARVTAAQNALEDAQRNRDNAIRGV